MKINLKKLFKARSSDAQKADPGLERLRNEVAGAFARAANISKCLSCRKEQWRCRCTEKTR